jgi:hypothetical protein
MEPEGALSCSQEPAAGPCSELDQSTPIQSIQPHPILLNQFQYYSPVSALSS